MISFAFSSSVSSGVFVIPVSTELATLFMDFQFTSLAEFPVVS